MTIVNRRGRKLIVHRLGPDHFWDDICTHYAKHDRQRWKCLAMLTLHESAGWQLEQIARAFGEKSTHVRRTLERLKGELRERFADGRDSVEHKVESRESRVESRKGRESAVKSRALDPQLSTLDFSGSPLSALDSRLPSETNP